MYWNRVDDVHEASTSRLIETWDVLKWKSSASTTTGKNRLIETWDVLKSWNITTAADQRIRLIETWDVLK